MTFLKGAEKIICTINVDNADSLIEIKCVKVSGDTKIDSDRWYGADFNLRDDGFTESYHLKIKAKNGFESLIMTFSTDDKIQGVALISSNMTMVF